MRLRSYVAGLSLLLLLPGAAAQAEEFLPLSIGNFWTYDRESGGIEKQVVDRTQIVRDREVYVIEYVESVVNDDLENYWTSGKDGDVFLHGFYRELDDFGFAYEPPILWADAPLYLGKTWSTTVDLYTYPGGSFAGTLMYTFQVYEEGVLSVPAGDFYAFGIGIAEPPAMPQAGFGVDGSVEPEPRGGTTTRWYSDSVGEVQYLSDDFYRLSQYNLPTPAGETTWGKLKALYF